MGSLNNRQSGFGAVGIILIILVVGVIAASGAFVVSRHNKHDASAASNTAAPTPPPLPPSAVSNPVTTSPVTSSVAISEWGIKAPYSGSLALSYVMSTDGTSASFSSSQLSKLSADCVGRGGAIKRYAANDKVSVYADDPTADTATTYFAKADSSTYAHVGGYYYTFLHDQAACGDITVTSAVHAQTNDAVKALTPTFQVAGN